MDLTILSLGKYSIIMVSMETTGSWVFELFFFSFKETTMKHQMFRMPLQVENSSDYFPDVEKNVFLVISDPVSPATLPADRGRGVLITQLKGFTGPKMFRTHDSISLKQTQKSDFCRKGIINRLI
ncbi:hypothetical protein ILYODFUR_031390 [Ilyodon furcidens]|uniref:Uncharacterized protein n=1 Tax=Ilyodon furcidens TaxID=33524 RepID=A0ABV0TQ09_9TELE